jgi:uncharacterized MnhB-related membrane protein
MFGSEIVLIILLSFMALCALGVVFTRSLLAAAIIFSAFGVVMSIVWLMMEAPDLAITEAAVSVGISGILLFLLLRALGRVDRERREQARKEDDHAE